MSAPEKISALVERFRNNISAYKNPAYNETQVRIEFIDPFFEALGWDVSNKRNYAEAYKEVIHEYSQKTKDTVEAPDYLFRIGGIRKFFVEAKKPFINIKDDPNPAFQLKRYAWSAKLPLSILTDFEEFIVYDCRIKPKINDKPSTGRILYFTFEDYIDKWEEINSVFSRDAVLKGSFDRFAESKKNKKGTAEVDDEFLNEIENWRDILAKNIALRNPALTNRELNFAVQKNIDRIIFLRICEDRGIEDYGQLMNLLNGVNIYSRLQQIYTRADEKYNSGLFYFEKEKGRSSFPDTLTPNLSIDDKILKEIIKKLYYPESPYEFSVLPADILGHVYEQFLGKVIRLTPSHRAIVEEKPEVKKAGGVYYTPTYIVDYIVKNTLGKKLEETEAKNSSLKNKIEQASKLRILDPACGSGSFLLGAYQYLLDWHLQVYIKENKPGTIKGNPVYEAANGEWRLSTSERKRILLNNIYGVDIDSQAVEVTKLSLLLKVLEGETEETLNSQLRFFRERALPDLGNNIKCGNSLIGPDFYDQMEMNFLDDEEKFRINVFDWNEEFKEIMSNGGFDVVIGNPPYVSIQRGFIDIKVYNYLINNFNIVERISDFFAIFIQKSTKLLKLNGYKGFIIPTTLCSNLSFTKLRKYLLDVSDIRQIINFQDGVFKNAIVPTMIFIIQIPSTLKNKVQIVDKIIDFSQKNYSESIIPQENFLLNDNFIFNLNVNKNDQKLLDKMKIDSILLKEIADIKEGIKTGNDKLFLSNVKKKGFYPCLKGKHINRFYYSGNLFINYLPNELSRPQKTEHFKVSEKLLIRRIGNRIIACYDNKQMFCVHTLYTLRKFNNEYSIKFLLALLNSKLFDFYYNKNTQIKGKIFPEVRIYSLNNLPIVEINSNNKSLIDKTILLIDELMESIRKFNESTNNDFQNNSYKSNINILEKQIDKLVYELYGLTEEEIKIVEGG